MCGFCWFDACLRVFFSFFLFKKLSLLPVCGWATFFTRPAEFQENLLRCCWLRPGKQQQIDGRQKCLHSILSVAGTGLAAATWGLLWKPFSSAALTKRLRSNRILKNCNFLYQMKISTTEVAGARLSLLLPSSWLLIGGGVASYSL